jgi:hypothetical protein
VIAVTLVVKPGNFTVTPPFLTFDATRWTWCDGTASGTNPPVQTLTITNPGDLPIAWKATASTQTGQAWLAVDRRDRFGVVPPRQSRTIRVIASPKGLAVGIYSGSIAVDVYSVSTSNPHGISKETETIPVQLNVAPAPATLCVSPRSLNFGALRTNSTSGTQTIEIENVGDLPMGAWSAQAIASRGRINLNPSSGVGPATVQLSITTDRHQGTQGGKIVVTAPGATKSPQTVNVTWKVQKPRQRPHGHHGRECDDDHDHDDDGDHDDDDHRHHRDWR